MRWTDTIERMLLLKVIEQNPTVRLDVDEALATWPQELDAPTKRGLGDRLALLKRHLKDGTVIHTVGASVTSTPSTTRQTIPKTPRSNRSKVKSEGSSTKRIKTDLKAEQDESEDDPVPNEGNPGYLTNINPTVNAPRNTFKSRLLNSRSATPATHNHRTQASKVNANGSGKRKRSGSDSDEDSMSSDESDTNSADNDSDESLTHTGQATGERRRSLPLRRSKSATPAKYVVDDSESESGDGDGSHTEQDEEDEHVGKHSKKGKGKVKKNAVTDDEVEDSDGLFDPTIDRLKVKEKRMHAWQERVAMIDGHDNDDDLQD